MDDRSGSVQESADMSISSDDDCIEQQMKSNVELEEDHGEAQADVLREEPELGMTFDTENDVREYYTNYAKAKGFGVTNKAILSPIAVRCAGRPPSLRKESRVDKAIREAREKKKKAEQREKKKAAQKEKRKSEEEVFLPIISFVKISTIFSSLI
jgi:hypothetical protein